MSTYDIMLLSAVDGKTLVHRSITGIPPEKTEVWKNHPNYKTFEPEWPDLKEALNQALDPVGAKITIEDDT